MTHVDEEVLAALAIGDPEVSPVDAEHVQSCATCRAGVAALLRVQSLLREEPALSDLERSPDPALWERIAAATTSDSVGVAPDQGASAGASEAPGRGPVTPIEASPRARQRPPRRGGLWRLTAAAGVCVLAGLGIGRLVWAPDQPAVQVVASTDLATLDGSKTLGRADLLDAAGTTELRVSATPLPDSPGYVEVWLINEDGRRMVSLGVLDSEKAVFAVPPSALAQGYRIVDLSRERYDNDARHSGDSIMRGTLPA